MVDWKPLNWAPWTMIFHMTYLESHKLDTLDPKIEHGIFETFQLDIPNLQIGHGKLERFKLDTPNLEIGDCKPMIPQIEHGNPEFF